MPHPLDPARTRFESDLERMRSEPLAPPPAAPAESHDALARVDANVLGIASGVFAKMYRALVLEQDSNMARHLSKSLADATTPAERIYLAYTRLVDEMLIRWRAKSEKDRRFGRERDHHVAQVQVQRMEAVRASFERHFGRADSGEAGDA